jgi:hypothetical protein
MLFAVRMAVDLPLDTPGREELLAREMAYKPNPPEGRHVAPHLAHGGWPTPT